GESLVEVLNGSERPVGLGSADYERPEERERVDESATFNEVGSASVLAHRPWWEEIPEFLTENIEPSVHDFRLTRETVAPAGSDESLGDNEWVGIVIVSIVVAHHRTEQRTGEGEGVWNHIPDWQYEGRF